MKEIFYTPQEVADSLNVAYMTVYRWIQSGKLKAYQLEKQYRINEADLKSFINKGEVSKLPSVSLALTQFIGSGMMDYAYIETRKFPVDLSLGVNPLGCSRKVIDYYKQNDIQFTNYSEVISNSLREKIGEKYGFDRDEILLGAGASDLLHLCYVTFMNPGEVVILPETTFPPLEFLAILVHGEPKLVPLTKSFDIDFEKIEDAITFNSKIIALCNPNNPTGKQVDISKTESLIKKYPDIVFLIDEANIDFGGNSFINLTKQYKNLIVLRSFSKGFGLAGLRIGFAVGNKELIYALQRRQTPFCVNIFAQKLANIALDDMTFLEKTKTYAQTERKYLEKELGKLGFSFVSSDSNYLLVDVSSKFASSSQFIEQINNAYANAVDGNDFKGMNGKYVRLSPRLHKVNKQFVDILKRLIVK